MFYYTRKIIKFSNTRGTMWAGHVASLTKMIYVCTKFLV
jgi:hypothetical protein